MDNKRVVVFDTETTGFKSGPNTITQLAAIELDGDRREAYNFFFLCDNLNPYVEKMTGLTSAKLFELSEGKVFENRVEEIERLFNGARVVGYNVTFDIRFLKSELENCGRSIDFSDRLCVFQRQKKITKTAANNKLVDALAYHNIEEEVVGEIAKDLFGMRGYTHAHDARWDTVATMLVAAEQDKWERRVLAETVVQGR